MQVVGYRLAKGPKVSVAWLAEAIDPEIVLGERDLSEQSVDELFELRRGQGALEDGLLDALSVPLAQVSNATKATATFRGVGRHVIGDEDLHRATGGDTEGSR